MTANRSFTNDAALSAVAAAAGRGLALLGIIVTTRVFPADVYGIWILILSFAGFFSPLATMRLEIPFVLARTTKLVTGLLTVIAAGTIVSLLIILMFSIFASASFFEWTTGLSQDRRNLIYFGIPTALLLVVQLLLQVYLMRTKQFKLLALSNITIPLINLVLTLVLPLVLDVSAALAAIIFLISTICGLAFGLPDFIRFISVHRSQILNYKIACAAFHRFSVYPRFTLPYSLSVSLTERITQLVIAQAYSVEAVASFFVARQFLSGFTSVIGGSLRNVFFAHSAQELDLSVTRDRAMRMLKFLSYLVAPCLAFAVFWIDDIIRFGAGRAWTDLPAMAWFCMFPATILMFTGPLDRVFDLVGKQRLSIALQICADVTMLLTIAFAVKAQFSSLALVAMITSVTAIYNLIWLGFTLRALQTTWNDICMQFLRFAVLFFACCGIYWLLQMSTQGLPSFLFSLLILAITLLPSLISLTSLFSGLRHILPPQFNNALFKLP